MLFIKTHFPRASSDFCFFAQKFPPRDFDAGAGNISSPPLRRRRDFAGADLFQYGAKPNTAYPAGESDKTGYGFSESPVERGGCLKRRPELQKPEDRRSSPKTASAKCSAKKMRYLTRLARRFSYACQSDIGWRAAPLSIAAFATAAETFTIKRLSNGLGKM